MNRTVLSIFAIIGLCTPVFAQTVNPYNGKWTITFDGNRTADVGGEVVVADDGGSWDIVARSTKNPCLGRGYPITVQKATAEEFSFTVNRAKTLVGCKDSTYTFKRVDDKTLRGELSEGRPATMVRN
jgi:hypothetical protein